MTAAARDEDEAREIDTADDPLVGQVVGDCYRVVRLLGEGGMSRLYAGVHTRLGTEVAIKVQNDLHGSQPEAIERAEREAKAMAGISSPYVARVFDLVRSADGRPCLVTELLHGEDLADRIERTGRLHAIEAARVARDMCLGLAETHAQGVLHRDIKPSNVFLTEEGQVKLLDFGVAKLEGTSTLTHAGAFIGTPAYMSPEQAYKASDVDERSDVYSLGAVLYHSLSGQPPYGTLDSAETLMRLLRDEPPRLTALASSVPEGLAAIVERAMSRDPKQRYPTASALAEALSPYARGTDQKELEREARWLRPRAIASVLFTALCAGGVAAAIVHQILLMAGVTAQPGDWRILIPRIVPAVIVLATAGVLLRALIARWRSAPRVRLLGAALRRSVWTAGATFGLLQIARAAAGLFGLGANLGEPLEVTLSLAGAVALGAVVALLTRRSP